MLSQTLTDPHTAGVPPAEQKCICGVALTMRICQRDENRGHIYYEYKHRNERCHDIFLWGDGKPNLKRKAPDSTLSGSSAPPKPPAGGVLAVASKGTSPVGSMRTRMEKRGRAVAVANDMSTHSVGVRELQHAMARSGAPGSAKASGSGALRATGRGE